MVGTLAEGLHLAGCPACASCELTTACAAKRVQEIIALNQDPLGVPGDLVWQQGTRKVFAAPLAGGGRGVVLLNQQTTQSQYPLSNVTVSWEQIGLVPTQAARVRDAFLGEESSAEWPCSCTWAAAAQLRNGVRCRPIVRGLPLAIPLFPAATCSLPARHAQRRTWACSAAPSRLRWPTMMWRCCG